jgi:hypothetical protein
VAPPECAGNTSRSRTAAHGWPKRRAREFARNG